MREGIRFRVAVFTLIAACGTGSQVSVTTTESPSIAPSTSLPPTTIPLVAGCPDEGQFVEGGKIGEAEQLGSDSTTIGSISWVGDEACESFSFTFTTSEGAPATTPPSIGATYLGDLPVIRILVDANHTIITDQLVETALVDRLYVVRGLDGGMFIDLHLAAPAQARLKTRPSPAGMTLDLQPGIVEYPERPTSTSTVILTSPLDGAIVDPLLLVTGYARTFESNVVVIATDGDHVTAEAFTTAADSVETWGEFEIEIGLTEGELSLFVGDTDPEDGGLDGVTVSLTVR